jgi:hypothetical protein
LEVYGRGVHGVAKTPYAVLRYRRILHFADELPVRLAGRFVLHRIPFGMVKIHRRTVLPTSFPAERVIGLLGFGT